MIRSFRLLSRRRRQALTGAGVAVAAVAGFTVYHVTSSEADRPLNVEFVLGGGADGAGEGGELKISGSYAGLAAAPDGTVYLFTQEDDGMVMWQRKPSGATKRTAVSGLDEADAEQAAVAPDGSVYLAAGDLWKVNPEGKATKVVRTCRKPDPLATTVKEFCAGEITGVALAEDGSLYIGDQVNWGETASYVHRIDGDSVERVAGRPPRDGESYKRSNPAVKNGVNPAAGTKAKEVLVTDNWNSGWLASGKDGLYWRSGPGIVRIDRDGTLSPFMAAAAPDRVTEGKGPFDSAGKARDAMISRNVSDGPRGGLAAVPGRGEVYYADSGEYYRPALEGPYRWRGASSDAQKELLEKSTNGKLVKRVSDGELSSVIAGVQALATSDDALYVAVEAETGDDRSTPENWTTAVVRVGLP
ncbi:hypothetical protein LHJ74_02995 [Streptomyces sp. N2-109]|uniref:Secreted protein n=1 Tax=Streptomyces gossypii TaxID=2883101 RepID=A0ABT2JNF8_9ACTN|nr:hypothetical protein [Streptomyces gossypii]MCT2588910.1 hypothetical protein [Streptomyces gossypii]